MAAAESEIVSKDDFEWLCQESARLRLSGATLVQLESQRLLRLDNYVGVLETPSGTRIEILPKIFEDGDDFAAARHLLRRMLMACLDLKPRVSALADVQAFDSPISEWVIQQFLLHLDALVKRGLRFDYHVEQDELRFLRGRLHSARQSRQPPTRRHIFQVEHDVFDANRPENRLLKLALTYAVRAARNQANRKLSHELLGVLAGVTMSNDVRHDFRRWGNDRLLAHYRDVRPWCALILNEQAPLAIHGEWRGASMLFPMQTIYERFVGVCLRRRFPAVTVRRSSNRIHFARHKERGWMALRPDFVLSSSERTIVVDAKWKLISQDHGIGAGYGLAEGDFYQLFAYGHRFLPAEGDMFLVYPMTSRFTNPLPTFHFSSSLRLHVVPFDVSSGSVIGEQIREALVSPDSEPDVNRATQSSTA